MAYAQGTDIIFYVLEISKLLTSVDGSPLAKTCNHSQQHYCTPRHLSIEQVRRGHSEIKGWLQDLVLTTLGNAICSVTRLWFAPGVTSMR